MLTAVLLLGASLQSPAAPVDFTRVIRPLLSDRCFACHGPDEAAREGGFRLDVRNEALLRAIVPGDAAASELVARVSHADAGERMPPPASKLELAADEIALLVRWIDGGAPYAPHWALVPPRRLEPDARGDSPWVRDPLDAHIGNALAAAGLAPAEPVDRATWLRRVSYDLTGLPPSLAELDAFLADGADGAYERQVERLLASPRHAERMATIWLDAARYADTYGYQADVERAVWPWRDWVLSAFEENLPYDQFLTWQLAGDLLPDATEEQRLATAFNRLHRQTNEGGSTEEEYRVEYVADRVDTLGEAVLGLTLGCARCHDHKFDPLTQREYYGLFAFFDDIDESGLYSHFTSAVPTPALDLATDAQRAELAQLEDALQEAQRALARLRPEPAPPAAEGSSAPQRDLQGRFSCETLEGRVLVNDAAPEHPGSAAEPLAHVAGRHGMALEFTGDDPATFGGIGAFRRSDPFTIGVDLWLPESYERAVVLHRSRAWHDAGSRGYELLVERGRASAALIHFWPGDALRVVAREPLPVRAWVHVTLTYDGSSRAAGLALYVDGEPVETEVVRDCLGRQIVGGGEGALTLGERFRDNGFKHGRMDELCVFARELAPGEVARLALGDAAPPWTAEQAAEAWRREHSEAYRAALEVLRSARRARDDARDRVPQIMTMRDLPEPRTAYVLQRGHYAERRAEVEPGTPASLGVLPPGPTHDRLDLARWLTRPGHPLTARVEVNRLWQLCFGTGLVATPEDFGSQGSPPSHPALLDDLALDFVASGWDRRALLTRFVLSATYRQASAPSAAARERDPENRLLSHMPRKRLSAEMLRDGALFQAGLLVERRGGPPARPYQPPGLWKEKSGQTYVPDEGEGLWRRSLYTIWKRTSPPPSMMLFDAAKRDVCVVRRQATSSPLQALVLWNDPQFVEAARKLGERMLREGGATPAEQVAFAFRLMTSRAPDAAELRILVALADDQAAAFAADPAAADALLAVGRAPRDAALDPVHVATCAVVAQALLSFDAALTTP
jgi:hypothetical protein